MAVNLLSLAKQLGGSLHSTPRKRRSSGRSSYQNQPSNLQRGTHIPGTGIRQNTGLASKGRRGDTKIRRVKGRPSHVNTAEARAIDTLGPVGEAWVQSVGSGTINPKTGLREYGWLSDATKGDWGMFGKTKARKARDRAIANARSRHATFEKFRRKYENENIAGIFTEDKADDSSGIAATYNSKLEPGFNSFVADLSGLVTSEADVGKRMTAMNEFYRKAKEGIGGNAMFKSLGEQKFQESDALQSSIDTAVEKAKASNKDDISDYTDTYDPRKQNEALDNFNRQGQQLGLQEEGAFAADTMSQKNVGAQLSSGLFGMLTQAQETESQKGFAGSGDFAQQFQQKEAMKDAERQVNAGSTDREMQIKEIGIQREQAAADLASQTKDLQEDYNQQFWESMVSWDSAVNA